MATPTTAPPAMCTLNEKGMKQYQKRIKAASDKPDPAMGEYESAKLPAHKAAFDGNTAGLEAVFISSVKNGGVTVADKGISPLHMAIKGNKMEAVKWLVKYTTTSVLNRTKDGKTAVHIAVDQGNMDCIKILLSSEEKGLKAQLATLEEKSGLTCLFLSIQKHQSAVFKYLLSELGPKSLTVVNSTGVTAAHVAATAGNFEVLRMIFSKNKKMFQLKTKDGCTPVYFAAQEGQVESLGYLHETAKCELTDATISQGMQPIHAAARGGHINVIEYLVTNLGKEVLHQATLDGSTPLHIAATVGDYEMCRWIVSYDNSGKVLTAQDTNMATPAHNAAESERADVLKFLIESGADPLIADKKGHTPQSIALATNKPDMMSIVKQIEPITDPTYDSIDDNKDKKEEGEEEKGKPEPVADTITAGEDTPIAEPLYSVPDPEVVAQKRASMNTGPPIPERKFDENEEVDGDKFANHGLKKKSSSILNKWPHMETKKEEEEKKKEPPKVSKTSVGSIWPPPASDVKKSSSDVPMGTKKKWPPEPTQEEKEEVKKEEEDVKEKEEEAKQEEVAVKEEVKEEEEEPPKPFFQLRKTVREPKATPQESESEVKLKAALQGLKKL